MVTRLGEPPIAVVMSDQVLRFVLVSNRYSTPGVGRVISSFTKPSTGKIGSSKTAGAGGGR